MKRFFLNLAAVAVLALTHFAMEALFAGSGQQLAILGAIAGLAAGTLGKAAGRAVSWVGKKVVGSATGRAVASAAAGAAVPVLIGRTISPGTPGFVPPSFAPQGTPKPLEGPVGRTISRILPGGNSGREYMPVEGVERDKYGRPIAVYPEQASRWKAPRGYVIVRDPQNPDADPVAILKGAARAMGLWSARPAPPVSGYDMRAINRAAAAQKRVKKLAGKVGFACKSKKC